VSGARLRFTLLGCGSSPGTPRLGNDWGACDPNEPRNRRRRTALLIERILGEGARTVVVVDTGPDFREQMLDAGIGWADGIVYTHEHADHVHGIDDLRGFHLNRRRLVDVYADAPTMARLQDGFGYCFAPPPGSMYRPMLAAHLIAPGEPFAIDGPGGPITLLPFRQVHGNIESLGFRIGGFAYSSDINRLPEESASLLAGIDTWVVDALRYTAHPSHFTVDEAMEWARRLGVRRTIFTHMHIDLDYRTLERTLPQGFEPGHDGLAIEVAA